MLGTLKSLAKVVVGTATMPVDLAADLFTMGGVMNERDKPYTVEKIGKIMDNLSDAADPKKD